ncbi:Ig-like domain-containing protein [Pseudomonas sp. Mn2068]|uniref:Ig-like domain-containing protein n=1 Tax=Pseudomonas sp. Mn2068 TaxID=3395265 RepID=UPI003BCD1E1F
MIIPLEPRMLFDGAVAATVAEAAQPTSHPTADAAKAPATDHAAAPAEAHPQSDAPVTPAPAAVPGQSVVFVDSRVKDFDSLLKGAAPGTQIVVLDASKDGLQQIADYLGSHQGVSTVEIIAHGNSGDLWLGNTYLSSDNVAARADVLAQIGSEMNVGGDILIYACNTAAGDKGIGFVDSLAQYTGRDIAASTNRTGLGGDWTLEIATGSIESHNALSADAMSAYQYGLATITVNTGADTGAGSLRQALSDAVAGDIVTFSTPGMTVNLNSQLVIAKNLTIDGDLDNNGTADVTISGQYKTQVLTVNSGVTATLDGLVITKGLMAGNGGNGGNGTTAGNLLGAGISNFGNLTLNNVSVTANAASGGGGGGGVVNGDVGGAGGGGGAVGGGNGGHGGITGSGTGAYAGGVGTANQGGQGGGYSTMGGHGGSSSGGAGSNGLYGYTNGSAGGTASSGSLSIGGGGGGSGWNSAGGKGGGAAGGIYNASGATLTIVGTSSITGNIGAGGGGGGGSATGSGTALNGGDGGLGVGAIWNKGTVLITAANFAALGGSANAGASGNGGLVSASGASAGNKPTAVNGLFNDIGATANTAYNPAPTATIVVSNTAQHIGSTSLVTITFNQAVTGFTNADLTIANGTLSNLVDSGDHITYTATFTPDSSVSSASNTIVLNNAGVNSVATGTAGSGTTSSNNFAIDTTRPTATISVSGPTLSTTANGTVSITFSEAVSGFSLSDMTASNGTLSNLTTSDNIHWTATLTPTAGNNNSGNVITLDNSLYTDTSTNAGTGTTTSNTYVIDTVLPTATIAVASPLLNIGGTSQVTITFSETVNNLTTSAFTVADGALSNLVQVNGTTWTATLTATAGITHTGDVITLNNTQVSDVAGNAGSGTTTSNTYAVDTQRPTATIVFGNTNLGIGQTSPVTITFSEAVTGFSNTDLTVSNGSLSAVSSSDGGITWTAIFTPTAAIVSASNHITLDNSGVADGAGNAGSGTSTSNNVAIDGVRPTATIVVADNALKIGDTSLVTITFSEAVVGFSNADLTLANGNLSAVNSLDGGITWTATFTPTTNITNTSNVITLDNTGYADTSGNVGTGTTDSNNYAIDTQRPTATIVVADPTLSAGETSLVTITFSEAVNNFSNTDLTIANGTLSAVNSSDGGITWTATFTPNANVNSATNVITLANTGIADQAGNTGVGTTNSTNFAINTVLPTASIVVANPSLNIGGTSQVTITFNEAVSGFTNADLSVANGSLSAVSSSDGGVTWTATLTATGNITDSSNLIVLDNSGVQAAASGNVGSGTSLSNNYIVDTQRPTATIAVTTDHLGIGGSSVVTITFNEAVTGFSLGDLTTDNGTLSNLSTLDNIVWTATLTPTAGITQNNNHIVLDNSTVTDIAGNGGSGTSTSNAYDVDSVRPTATIVVANPTLAAGDTSLVTITFSEAVSNFDNSDLNVPNGTLSAVSSSDGGVTWTATFTPTGNVHDTSNLISLNNSTYTDLAGNAGVGVTNSGNFTIDTVRPSATIVVADNSLTIGETSTVTITFSEAVSGFSNADLTISNGTLTTVATSDGGITWTATFTPTSNIADSSNLVVLDNSGVTNASGNAGSGTTNSNNFSIDTQRPTATIAVSTNALNIGGSSVVTITFSEAVTGLSLGDLTAVGGTLSGLSTLDNITWTATLTPNAATTQSGGVIGLNNALFSDIAGNAGTGTTESNTYSVDTVAPTASIVVSSASLLVGQTATVTITFSEAVAGLDNSDLSVPNGTLSTLTSSDGGVTWTGTFTPTSNVHDTTNLISLNNTGYTDLAGNAGTGVTNSANFTIDTVRPTATIVVAVPSLNAGASSAVTITFSEAVSGFSNADLTISNGTLTNVSSSDGGITWTATLTPTSNVTDTTNVITLANSGVTNASGNAGSGTTDSNNYSIDTQRPGATISVANPHVGIGQTTTVSITFNEAVTGFDLSDLSVANGVLSNLTTSDNIHWTATLTPTVGVTDATNLIVLDNSLVTDGAGNTGSGIAISNNYGVDADLPTATIVVANPNLTAGQTTTVTFTFSEKVTGFDLSDLSVANGVLSNLASSDGGKTWTATLTPTANITDPSNFITLDTSLVTDLAGNAGTGFANSNNYGITTVSLGGDPQFRITDPAPAPDLPNVPLQPIVFGPPGGNLGSPIGFPPLFEQRDVGGGLPPLGNIFIRNGALAPSFIAQVFSTDSGGDGSGSGFLGFGGGDGGVFGSSTLSGLFNRESTTGDSSGFKAFERQGSKSLGDPSQGLRGIFGAPTLGQQLQQLKDSEQKQLHELAWALEQVGVSEIPA